MKKIIPYLSIVLFISFFSCTDKKVNTNKNSISEEKKTTKEIIELYDIWGLKGMQGKPYDIKSPLVLEINTHEMNFMGNANCNNFSGNLSSISKGQVNFKDIMATEMACDELSTEQQYLNLLITVESYQLKSMHLLLFDKDKNLVLDFIKMD